MRESAGARREAVVRYPARGSGYDLDGAVTHAHRNTPMGERNAWRCRPSITRFSRW